MVNEGLVHEIFSGVRNTLNALHKAQEAGCGLNVYPDQRGCKVALVEAVNILRAEADRLAAVANKIPE